LSPAETEACGSRSRRPSATGHTSSPSPSIVRSGPNLPEKGEKPSLPASNPMHYTLARGPAPKHIHVELMKRRPTGPPQRINVFETVPSNLSATSPSAQESASLFREGARFNRSCSAKYPEPSLGKQSARLAARLVCLATDRILPRRRLDGSSGSPFCAWRSADSDFPWRFRVKLLVDSEADERCRPRLASPCSKIDGLRPTRALLLERRFLFDYLRRTWMEPL
jgi:hypothetical protein